MKYSSRILIGHIIISVCILLFSIIGFAIASFAVNLTFSVLVWLSDGNFHLSLYEILRSIKIGSVGGGVLGIGIVLFRLFKVKGF